MSLAVQIIRWLRLAVAVAVAVFALRYAVSLDYQQFVTTAALLGCWVFLASAGDVLSSFNRQSTDTWDWQTVEYRQQLDAEDVVHATLTGYQAHEFARQYIENRKK